MRWAWNRLGCQHCCHTISRALTQYPGITNEEVARSPPLHTHIHHPSICSFALKTSPVVQAARSSSSVHRWPCFAKPLVVVQTFMSYVSATYGVSCGMLWNCCWWLTRSDLFTPWEVHPGHHKRVQPQTARLSTRLLLFSSFPCCIEHALAHLFLLQCPTSMSTLKQSTPIRVALNPVHQCRDEMSYSFWPTKAQSVHVVAKDI